VQFWMGLQDEYELREAKAKIGDALEDVTSLAA
jgi:plasmid maintenance system antidote protein VapI